MVLETITFFGLGIRGVGCPPRSAQQVIRSGLRTHVVGTIILADPENLADPAGLADLLSITLANLAILENLDLSDQRP